MQGIINMPTVFFKHGSGNIFSASVRKRGTNKKKIEIPPTNPNIP
jgi:hypothetical protein